jgi:polyphosphate kinase
MMIFANGGDPLYYISSADWMERNLDKRIEVGTPIFDVDIQQELAAIFKMQWNDSVKARVLDKAQRNNYKQASGPAFQSQQELWKYYADKSKEA